MTQKEVVTNTLWIAGLIGAFLFCIPHFFRSLQNVEGISVAQISAVIIYLGFHLTLAWGAYKTHASRVTLQTISVYCTWLGLTIAILTAIWINGSYAWSVQDTTITVVVLLCTVGIVLGAFMSQVNVLDPAVQAGLAITFKAVPQALLAWKIAIEGGNGIPAISIVIGNITILLRLGQIWFMVREAGWDQNRKWLFVSESINELSWFIASVTWALA